MKLSLLFCLFQRIGLVLLVVLSGAFSAFSQDLKKVVEKNKGYPVKEVYYVLKNNEEVKHGPYEQISQGRTVTKGQFESNQRRGVWEFYDLNGELVQKYDYSGAGLVYDKMQESSPGSTDSTSSETFPVYIGGLFHFYLNIAKNLNYPAEAAKKKITGKVMIQFDVNEEGEMINFAVKEGIGGGCEEEALRVLKSMPGKWVPGKINGKAVKVNMVIPVSFAGYQ